MKNIKKILCLIALGAVAAGCQNKMDTSSAANNNPGMKGQDSYTNNPALQNQNSNTNNAQ